MLGLGKFGEEVGLEEGGEDDGESCAVGLDGAVPASKSDVSHDKTGLEIEDIVFCSLDPTLGAALKVNVVGSPSGATNIAYAWGEGTIDDDVAEAFVHSMHEVIQSVVLG